MDDGKPFRAHTRVQPAGQLTMGWLRDTHTSPAASPLRQLEEERWPAERARVRRVHISRNSTSPVLSNGSWTVPDGVLSTIFARSLLLVTRFLCESKAKAQSSFLNRNRFQKVSSSTNHYPSSLVHMSTSSCYYVKSISPRVPIFVRIRKELFSANPRITWER